MALFYPDRLLSNNPAAYGIVKATEVTGHRTVAVLTDLYAIADCVLSDTKGSTPADAVGLIWYVQSEGACYKLINWANRKSDSGWEKQADISQADLDLINQDINNLKESHTQDINKINELITLINNKNAEQDNALNSLPDKLITNITNATLTATTVTVGVSSQSKGEDNVYEAAQSSTLTIPGATSSAAGVMSKEDKTRLDGIFAGNLALPTPVITGTWTFYNNAGTDVESSSISPAPDATNPTLENGYKAKFVGTYKWTHEDGKKDPTQVLSGSSWSDLPATGVNSQSYDSGQVSTNTTVKIGILAAKTGLMVGPNGKDVVPASGMDTTSAQRTVSFSNRIYYGNASSTDVTETVIKGLTSVLGARGRTLSGVTSNTSQYYVYAYPKSLGLLSTIIQDGATPVLGAFTLSELAITNAAGLSVTLYVYRANNPGAFTNVSLRFE